MLREIAIGEIKKCKMSIGKISYNCTTLKITKDFEESRDCYHAPLTTKQSPTTIPWDFRKTCTFTPLGFFSPFNK